MSVQKSLVKQKANSFILENPQTSVKSSVEFLKKLTVVSVSCIAFLRNIFPSGAFSPRNYKGTNIWILRGDDEIPGSQILVNWLKSAFGAVELHILKKMILVIQKQNSDETLEIYTFNYSYNKEEIHCEIINESSGNRNVLCEGSSQELPENIKKSVQHIMRSVLVITNSLEALPDDCELSMKLEFNDDVPDDFELPKHFNAVDSLGITFDTKPSSYKLGKVESRFSAMELSTKTVCLTKEDGDNESHSEATGCLSEDDEVQPSQAQDLSRSFTSPTNEVLRDITNSEQGEATTSTSLSLAALSVKEKEVKCICECNDNCNDDLTCNSCFTLQHRACYKVSGTQEVGKHICVNCHDPSNPKKTCSDFDLLNNKKRKEEALYRRALVLCLSNVRVSATTFVNQLGVSRQTATQIFNGLDKDGCLRPAAGKGNVRLVKTDHIKEVLDLKFKFLPAEAETSHMEFEENTTNKFNMKKRKRTSSNQLEEDTSPERNLLKRKKQQSTNLSEDIYSETMEKENWPCGRNSPDQPKRLKYSKTAQKLSIGPKDI